MVGGKTLFYVQERVFSFSPEDRAKAIGERIERLYRNPKISLDAIRVEDQETATEIVAGDMVITTVTDNDAKAAGRGRQELANQYAQIIRATVQELRTAHSLKTIGLGVIYSLIATILLILALILMKKLFPRLYAMFRSWHGTRIRSLRIQKLELVSAERITDLLITFARGVRLLATLVLL